MMSWKLTGKKNAATGYWVVFKVQEYLRENKTFQAADYLIDTYRKRLNSGTGNMKNIILDI